MIIREIFPEQSPLLSFSSNRSIDFALGLGSQQRTLASLLVYKTLASSESPTNTTPGSLPSLNGLRPPVLWIGERKYVHDLVVMQIPFVSGTRNDKVEGLVTTRERCLCLHAQVEGHRSDTSPLSLQLHSSGTPLCDLIPI